jgi:hypothetical protein
LPVRMLPAIRPVGLVVSPMKDSGSECKSFFAPDPSSPCCAGHAPSTSSSPVDGLRVTRPAPADAVMTQVWKNAVTPASVISMPGSIDTR